MLVQTAQKLIPRWLGGLVRWPPYQGRGRMVEEGGHAVAGAGRQETRVPSRSLVAGIGGRIFGLNTVVFL